MNCRRFTLLAAGLLLTCQLGIAQSQYGPKTAAQMRALAGVAAQTPHGLAVVPKSLPGHRRPMIWMGEMFSKVGISPLIKPALPSFCNVNNSRGGFNWCPNALQIAYGTNNVSFANGGAGMTIGITDAFHYANVESDLAFFNSEMGLPPCTKASGCFKNLDQNGNDATNTTCGSDSGWELETMLDVEWAHAMAPNAHITLVEGCTNEDSDLDTAVTSASKITDVISNSWGEDEFVGETASDPVYFLSVPILFASGDSGAPAIYPCQSPNATCVGGTRIMPVSTSDFHRGTETGWAGSGGGCSIIEGSQAYQINNGVTLCGSFRAAPDWSAEGDPDTGVIVYDSGNGGHFRVGGTSVATPLTAGFVALLDTARTTVVPTFLRKPKLQGAAGAQPLNASLYLKYAGAPNGNPYTFYYFDVTSGNNGFAAGPGYDLVTGLGVINVAHAGPPWNLP